jgi:tRNA (cytidine/uridine-2'-O-)-methyltransferase
MVRIVLFQPEIPPNTGNVARSCAATETELHLIEPLGFTIDDRQLRRAGLDYWPWVQLERHRDFECFQAQRLRRGGRLLAFSSQGGIPYTACRYRADDWLLFGRESEGLPASVLACANERLTIPMARHRQREGGGVRSLNLSVSVAVGLFEALRQIAAEA